MVVLRRQKNKAELQETIVEYWEQIPIQFFENVFSDWTKKMEKVINDANCKIIESDSEEGES